MTRPSLRSIAIGFAGLSITSIIGVATTYVLNRIYVRFEEVGMGSIRMEPDGRGGVSAYLTSDGVNLVASTLRFQSTEDATKAFEKIIGDSKKITSREFVHDRDGKSVVGERVVGLFPADDGRAWPMMVCLDGNKLYQVSSTSLRHILIFEKSHRRY